jgi:hypothetical protein
MTNIIEEIDKFKHLISALFSISATIYIFDARNKLSNEADEKEKISLTTIGFFFILIALLSLLLQFYDKNLEKQTKLILGAFIGVLYAINSSLLLKIEENNDNYKIFASFSLGFVCAYIFIFYKTMKDKDYIPDNEHMMREDRDFERLDQAKLEEFFGKKNYNSNYNELYKNINQNRNQNNDDYSFEPNDQTYYKNQGWYNNDVAEQKEDFLP